MSCSDSGTSIWAPLGLLVHQDPQPARKNLQPTGNGAITVRLARDLERQRGQRLRP